MARTEKSKVSPAGRVKASNEDFMAAKLHRAQEENIELRKLVVSLRRQLIEQANALDERKISAAQDENAALRERHNLAFGKIITKDAETGEVYWSEQQS